MAGRFKSKVRLNYYTLNDIWANISICYYFYREQSLKGLTDLKQKQKEGDAQNGWRGVGDTGSQLWNE